MKGRTVVAVWLTWPLILALAAWLGVWGLVRSSEDGTFFRLYPYPTWLSGSTPLAVVQVIAVLISPPLILTLAWLFRRSRTRARGGGAA